MLLCIYNRDATGSNARAPTKRASGVGPEVTGNRERLPRALLQAAIAPPGTANERRRIVTKHELDIQCLARESGSFKGTGLGGDQGEPQPKGQAAAMSTSITHNRNGAGGHAGAR